MRRRLSLFVSFLLVVTVFAHNAMSQSIHNQKRIGKPVIEVFTPKDYNGNALNYSLVQGDDGRMYFANYESILTYDGEHWAHVELKDNKPIISLAKNSAGTIFYGGIGDIGYLEVDKNGSLINVSLLDKFPNPKVDFTEVWDILTLDNDVYFRSQNVLIRWKDNKINLWEFEDHFRTVTILNESVFFRSGRDNIYKIENDKFNLFLDSASIEGKAWRFFELKNEKFLFITTSNKLKLIDNGDILHLNTELENALNSNEDRVREAVVGPNGNIYLASDKALYVTTQDGRLIAKHDSDLLGKITPTSLFFDKYQNLWIAGYGGIVKIDLLSPSTKINASDVVNDMIEFNGKIYISTMDGVKYLEENVSEDVFKYVEGDKILGAYGFLSFNDQLLVGTSIGVFAIKNKKAFSLDGLNIHDCKIITRSKLNPNRIFISSNSGLHSALWNGNSWKIEKWLVQNAPCFEPVETATGNLLISGWSPKLLKLSYSDDFSEITNESMQSFEITDLSAILEYDNRIYLVNQNSDQLLQYNEKNESLDKVNDQMAQQIGYEDSRLQAIYFGNINTDETLLFKVLTRNADDKDGDSTVAFVKVSNHKISEIAVDAYAEGKHFGLYEDSKARLWFYGSEGIWVYDESFEQTVQEQIQTNIINVTYQSDSLLYRGYYSPKYSSPKLPHRENSIRFDYAITSFYDANINYQYQLEGFDTQWSKNTNSTTKEYTNLDQGNYTFRIKGIDIYNNTSTISSYSFTILPPWYSTWWAYFSYVLFVVFSFIVFDKVRRKKMIKDKRILEKTVYNRTIEINNQSKILQEQKEKLEIQAEKLRGIDKLKSTFFANISHEFRTPITLIQGPLERMLNTNSSTIEIKRAQVERMFRNSKRLHILVDQLLDLVDLDEGNIGLQLSHKNILNFFRNLANSFTSLAESENIEYIITVSEKHLTVPFDTDALEKIYYNLIVNAFKFTPEYGQVRFVVEFLSDSNNKIENFENQNPAFVKVTITDTGEGISNTMINHVFDRFAKSENSDKAGAGIGLSLVKELVNLYGGQLNVESKLGVGTNFIVTIPLDIDRINPKSIKSIDKPFDQQNTNPLVSKKDSEESPLIEYADENSIEVIDSEIPQLLIIEDDKDVRDYLTECLQDEYAISVATNGKEGLKIIKDTLPDLVLSDIVMEEMDGITFLKKIKENEITSHIPVILLTGKADEDVRLQGYKHGADAYIVKPFSERELKLRIEKIIQQREKLVEKYTKEIILMPINIKVSDRDGVFIKKVIDLIEVNIDNTDFGVSHLQNEFGVSRMQLHRKLIALTKMSATEFVKHIRLLRAEQLLRESSLRVSEVGHAVGFLDPSYFSKCFKQQFGVTPSIFAKNIAN